MPDYTRVVDRSRRLAVLRAPICHDSTAKYKNTNANKMTLCELTTLTHVKEILLPNKDCDYDLA